MKMMIIVVRPEVKVVLHRSHGIFFGVKVKTVKLIGGRRFLAARSSLIGAAL